MRKLATLTFQNGAMSGGRDVAGRDLPHERGRGLGTGTGHKNMSE